jgi:4-hydroxy-tetrahydrodipicolinate synthase
MGKLFTGVYTALVTPFTQSGDVDMASLGKLLMRQMEAGVDGVALCATTGEGSALTLQERKEILTFALGETQGQCAVIAGTGTNSLASTLEQTRLARDLGCRGALIVTPYYNKPTPEGLVRYYMQIFEQVDIPVVLYNVPSRTAVDMLPDTVARLAGHPRCAGIKEATGNMVRVLEIRMKTGEGFSILSGDDLTFLPFLACGGDGIICTSSNVIPGEMVRLYGAWIAGEIENARRLHASQLDMYRAMFVETNPGPAKWALNRMGLIEPVVRPPLAMPDGESAGAAAIEKALRSRGLLD